MEKAFLKNIKNNTDKISYSITDFITKHYNKIFIATVIILAFLMRLYFVPWQSGDYVIYLKGWFSHFKENGLYGFKNIYTDVNANYHPLYMFIIALMSYLPQPIVLSTYPDLFVILYVKLPSILSDFLIAYVVYRFIKEYTNKKHIALIAFTVCLFAPMAIINSSLWGQADSLYSAFVLLSAYLLWRGGVFLFFFSLWSKSCS